MTVKLTSNFLTNARGLTLKDGNGAVWSINTNTNEITVAVAGASGGTVTSVALSDGSTTPVYTISGSPVTVSGTLTFTLKTQSANLVLAGPTTGAAAQPTFRLLVAADIPTIPASGVSGLATVATSGAYTDLSGAPTFTNGSFTGTPTGVTSPSSSTVTVKWARTGNQVTMMVPAVTGTSSSTAFTITGTIPAAILPVTTQWAAVSPIEDAGSTGAAQYAVSVSTGVITFAKNGSTTGFTNSSTTKGISSTISFTYQLT